MGRYLVIVGRSEFDAETAALAAAATRLRLKSVFVGPDVTVLSEPELRARSFDGGKGVVLGRLLRRTATCEDAPAVLSAGARSVAELLARFWGGYVAVLNAAPEVTVLRDPSGALGCWNARWRGLELFASDPELLRTLELVTPRLDWSFVVQRLAFPQLRTASSGWLGVTELAPGAAVGLRDGAFQVRAGWTPWRFLGDELAFADMGEASLAIRHAVQSCTTALNRQTGQAAVRLSGGLDSSIVALSLGASADRLTCLNLLTPGADGDERAYAGAVAERLGAPLRVIAPQPAAIDFSTRGASPRPSPPGVLQGLVEALDTAVAAIGARAVFTGAGGDNVFGHLASAAPAADQLLASGPGRQFWRTTAEIAQIHQMTRWRVARSAFRQALARPALDWRPDLRFVALPPLATPTHPWMAAGASRPGARALVNALLRSQHHVESTASGSGASLLHPLLAQPVIETCLRVPSRLWVAGGVDRAAARAAFSHLLPSNVLQRRTKGRLDSYCGEVFRLSRSHVRRLLLEGRLAARGLLDRSALQTYLDRPGPPRDLDFYRILDLADVEVWCRNWPAA